MASWLLVLAALFSFCAAQDLFLAASPETVLPTQQHQVHNGKVDKPNIVLVLQDDMDLYMQGWTPMRQTTALVSNKGATANNWFIHTPVCCPSRGELLSGRYFHNIRMPNHKGGCMHINTTQVNPATFATYLSEAGYTNAYFGKHLNNCPHSPPPGFDCPSCYWFAYGGDTARAPNCKQWLPEEQGGGCKGGGYYDSAFFDFDGGVPANMSIASTSPNPVPGFYQADRLGEYAGYSASIVANKTIAWIKRVAHGQKPWMVTVGNRAPHAPFSPAPWYEEGMPGSAWIANLTAPRTPDYNASCPDHHWLVAHQDIITEEQAAHTDNVFRNRWRALLSVDDGIAGIVDAVEELGVANRTYIIITSDHGWNLGQHRLPGGKHNVYDHSVRIPFVIRGPGIARNSKFDFPASNVDVGPTLLGLAGVSDSATMDGRSVAPLLVDPDDSAVLPATQRHIAAQTGKSGRLEYVASWRTFHPIEFAALNNHTWFGHLVDDVVSNTYRAMRFVADPSYGDLLYAEFTAVTDWHFESPVHFELFNMTEDPHQLKNIYYSSSHALRNDLQKRLVKQWTCAKGTSNPCP